MSEQIEVSKADTRFEIRASGELAGFVEYSDSDGVRTMPHTEVDEKFQGRGLASQLIGKALEATRADGLQVLPVCPAVQRYIGKHPDLRDLVPSEQRERFELS